MNVEYHACGIKENIMSKKENMMNAIELNSDIAVWTREYNEIAGRIEAGYVNEDAYQPLKQKINEFLDQKFKKRARIKKMLPRMTVVMLLLWVAAFVASRFHDPVGERAVLVAGQWFYKSAGLINDTVMDWLMLCMMVLPVVYIALLLWTMIKKLKCEKAIVDAMTFDKRHFAGEICRLRNTSL